jgi:hypothetical protein
LAGGGGHIQLDIASITKRQAVLVKRHAAKSLRGTLYLGQRCFA